MQIGAAATSSHAATAAAGVEPVDAAAAPLEKQAVSAAIARISGQAATDLRPLAVPGPVFVRADGRGVDRAAAPVAMAGVSRGDEAAIGAAAQRPRSGPSGPCDAADVRGEGQVDVPARDVVESNEQETIERETIVAESVLEELIVLETIAQAAQAECEELEALLEQAEQSDEGGDDDEDDDDDGDVVADIEGLADAVHLSSLAEHAHHVGKPAGSTGGSAPAKPQWPRTVPKAPHPKPKGKGSRSKRRAASGRMLWD